MKTTGIIEMGFKFYNSTIRMIDVGGQRNERKKWIHCFEGVTAIIFVVALSEYDQRCIEDDKTNRMEESLKLFKETAESKYFESTPIILFLNKMDLFKEKIQRVDLNVCFPDYNGGCDYDKAVRHIKTVFVNAALTKDATKSKDIFTHLTCATSTDQLRQVFGDIKKIILRGSLEKSGIL